MVLWWLNGLFIGTSCKVGPLAISWFITPLTSSLYLPYTTTYHSYWSYKHTNLAIQPGAPHSGILMGNCHISLPWKGVILPCHSFISWANVSIICICRRSARRSWLPPCALTLLPVVNDLASCLFAHFGFGGGPGSSISPPARGGGGGGLAAAGGLPPGGGGGLAVALRPITAEGGIVTT